MTRELARDRTVVCGSIFQYRNSSAALFVFKRWISLLIKRLDYILERDDGGFCFGDKTRVKAATGETRFGLRADIPNYYASRICLVESRHCLILCLIPLGLGI